MIGGDWRLKPRLSLRGTVAVVAVVALVLAAISPAARRAAGGELGEGSRE